MLSSILMNTAPLYREVQYYRHLPPFTLLTAVGTVFGWALVVWVGLMGRAIGAMTLPPWLALAIGLPLGVLLPLAYWRLKMVTEVLADRLVLHTGLTGRVVLPYDQVVRVETRREGVHDDYNPRNIGVVRQTRTAYTVLSNDGVELTYRDGRMFLVGSTAPDELTAAVAAAWRAAQPRAAAEPAAEAAS
jgi:hypothetical protein